MRCHSPAPGLRTFIALPLAAFACGCSTSQENVSTGSLPPRPQYGMMREPAPVETGTLGYTGRPPANPPPIQTGSVDQNYAYGANRGSPPAPRYRWRDTPVQTGSIDRSTASYGDPRWHASPRPTTAPLVPPSAVPPDSQLVEVREGDTLFGLARRHGVSVAELAEVNRLQSAQLQVGQRLYVPAPR